MTKKKEQVTLEDNEDFKEFVSVPKDQFDFILYKANFSNIVFLCKRFFDKVCFFEADINVKVNLKMHFTFHYLIFTINEIRKFNSPIFWAVWPINEFRLATPL